MLRINYTVIITYVINLYEQSNDLWFGVITLDTDSW